MRLSSCYQPPRPSRTASTSTVQMAAWPAGSRNVSTSWLNRDNASIKLCNRATCCSRSLSAAPDPARAEPSDLETSNASLPAPRWCMGGWSCVPEGHSKYQIISPLNRLSPSTSPAGPPRPKKCRRRGPRQTPKLKWSSTSDPCKIGRAAPLSLSGPRPLTRQCLRAGAMSPRGRARTAR